MGESRGKERMRPAASQMKYLPGEKCIAELKPPCVLSGLFFPRRGTGALAFRRAARFLPLGKGK